MVRAVSRPAASITKHTAESGAIRPGYEVPTVPVGSQNSHRSKPGFHPKTYSPNESRPISPATRAQNRERRETKAEG